MEERENVNQQPSFGPSSYSSLSGSPVFNKSLNTLVSTHFGERELPATGNRGIHSETSSLPVTQSISPSVDQIEVSCDDYLPKYSLSCEPLVPCCWSLSASIQSDTFEDTAEANGKLQDKEVEPEEDGKVTEEEEGGENEDEKKDDEERKAAVVVEEKEVVDKAGKGEVVKQEEKLFEVVTSDTQLLSIASNILDTVSILSLPHSSQEFPQNEPAAYSLPCSSSHHMSAYLKLVGKCSTRNNSPTSSLTSEGSNLEKDLLEVMEGGIGEGGVESEAHFLIGPSLTMGPADRDSHMEGGISVGDEVRMSGVISASRHPTMNDGRGEEATRRVIVDNTSLKRRMGECLA